MTDTRAGASPAQYKWLKFGGRLIGFLLLATLIGWTLNRISNSLERSSQPAGFSRGMLQGALMPMAMPNLLVGRDIIIYSTRNTGLPYKLGYTLGVNMCGALFFGFFFWRLNQLRRVSKN
jgi:hypothetical protein